MPTALDTKALVTLGVDLVLALLLNQILAWHFVRCAHTLSNRRRFARMFVLVGPTTLLVLAAVQSSLALSLGLVGALSIIRFRTPIKEPEELAYLFVSLATGIGLGSGQRVLTIAGFTAVVAYTWLRERLRASPAPVRTVLQVTAPLAAERSGADELQTLIAAVEAACEQVDLRRVDRSDGELHCSLLVDLDGAASVGKILASVRAVSPSATVSVVEYEGIG
jgi:hypothetical protein